MLFVCLFIYSFIYSFIYYLIPLFLSALKTFSHSISGQANSAWPFFFGSAHCIPSLTGSECFFFAPGYNLSSPTGSECQFLDPYNLFRTRRARDIAVFFCKNWMIYSEPVGLGNLALILSWLALASRRPNISEINIKLIISEAAGCTEE